MLGERANKAMQRIPTCGALLVTAAFLFGLSQANRATAQSVSSIHIGDPASQLTKFGPASETSSDMGMQSQKWSLPDGDQLSATVDSTGRIVYLEADWTGKGNSTACDLPGLNFGVTTLAQIRTRLGSNGFGFQNRAGVIPTGMGVVMLNSYQVGKVIVTFYTKVDEQKYLLMKNSDPNSSISDYATLEAISLADLNYVKAAGWGDLIYDPGYKDVEWK
jgi:hypothetical protein